LVDLTVGRSARAMVIGFIGGPLAYIVVLAGFSGVLDEARTVPLDAFIGFVVSTICGIDITLLGTRVRRLGSPPKEPVVWGGSRQ